MYKYRDNYQITVKRSGKLNHALPDIDIFLVCINYDTPISHTWYLPVPFIHGTITCDSIMDIVLLTIPYIMLGIISKKLKGNILTTD